jgi:hypothetical protein
MPIAAAYSRACLVKLERCLVNVYVHKLAAAARLGALAGASPAPLTREGDHGNGQHRCRQSPQQENKG